MVRSRMASSQMTTTEEEDEAHRHTTWRHRRLKTNLMMSVEGEEMDQVEALPQ